ncbi:AAA family ATPase [Anatilimnocola floriformis]|uniref:AAA family ATPase n=1 Tax=Anatilimnocola floriformis TaxID=2948575 RepID=UPI0020C21EE2|nr:AAA family ATPase [Anatilimnocola floriformis]
MELTLPIYIEVRREGGRPIHHVRTLFMHGPQAADAHLGLAMGKFNKRLKEQLDGLGRQDRHEDLMQAAFSPPLQSRVIKLTIELKHRQARVRFLFATFAALERRVAFTPSLPMVWFEYETDAQLEAEATRAIQHHYRELEKVLGHDAEVRPEDEAIPGQAWISTVDIEVNTRPFDEKKMARAFAALLDDTRVDGGVELQRVGRCLDWLYPAELHQAVGRDREVSQLYHLLDGQDCRPIVLVGPRLAGKTTVLHETVRRRVARRGKPYSAKLNVWLLSPQRLISGMMYVGQWEGRLQAILKVARKQRHVLYFDDFLGLYRAGISRDASLCAADVIKPFIQRREVRVLAEMTPEAWQTFCERDRGLADQFHVIRVDAMGEEATRRVMIQVLRNLEAEHHLKFNLDALPSMLQLQQGYIRDAAFPGKSAAFARQLALKMPSRTIARREVYDEFHRKTGLALSILDEQIQLNRSEVLKNLQQRMIGQEAAVSAAADVVTIAKARLADRSHPLAVLLFLGPTGVGKTQCAKVLAEVMYSDPARLLRFDMNEYASPSAAAQLLGTPGEPDGLLTSAVRRQPFSIVLLDEIEKAHPDVFDLLLQVTGEGRLTDALGRTADFSNTVVVMTSNLGTAHGGQIGLANNPASRQHVFVKAAESFFRPEFFNRIDRVIPFESLSRDQMRNIAQLLLEDIFRRDGLVRRRCALCVHEAAMESIVDAGYHPQFGARALKRAIEQQLMHPVAASLSGVNPELPAVITVYPAPEGVTAAVQPLGSVQANDCHAFDDAEPAEKIRRIAGFLDRVEDELESHRPASSGGGRGLSAEQIRYYALKEQLQQLREMHRDVSELVAKAASAGPVSATTPRIVGPTKELTRNYMRRVPIGSLLRDFASAQDVHDYLTEAAQKPKPEATAARLLDLRYEAAHLQTMLASASEPQDVLFWLKPLVRISRPALVLKLQTILSVFKDEFGFSARIVSDNRAEGFVAHLSGSGIGPLARAEAGIHMFCEQKENLIPVQVWVLAFSGDAATAAKELRQQHDDGLVQLRSGQATAADDPFPLGNILRFYDEAGSTIDLRSGLTQPTFPTTKEWKTLLLAGLPLPPELAVRADDQEAEVQS